MQELSQSNSSHPTLRGEPFRPSSLDSKKAWLQWLRWHWSQSTNPPSLPRGGYRFSHPLIEVLSYLIEERSGLASPPLRLEEPSLPLHELCQLSLLWSLAGQKMAARNLAASLLPILSFSSLFCPEEEYNEQEARASSLLLQYSCAESVESLPTLSDPYLAKLATHLPLWNDLAPGVPYNARLLQTPHFTFAESFNKNRGSLGALQMNSIEIRAIGPQGYPLNAPERFGTLRRQEMGAWSAVAADPSTWLNVDASGEDLLFHFVGTSAEKPIALSCYLLADQVKIGEAIYRPQSLKRYRGEYRDQPLSVEIQKGPSHVRIEAKGTRTVELIPLAGEGCFWNCNFLLAFEIPAFEGLIRLCIR